jgi:type II secretion system protein D
MLVLASATAVSAQDAPKRRDVPRSVKAPKGQPPDAAASNAANQPPPEAPPPPPGAPATVRLQFPNSDVVDVLHLYEQLTGKKLVMDNFVQGKVNIFIAKDVSRDEAIKIIEISMALNGISLVPVARDIVDVVGAGQNPRKAPVPIISDLADIPAGNPVVSVLFRLQYADPQELQQVLMAYFQGSSGTINILALPKSSSLLVTQNADIIRQLAGVIEQIDVAPAEVVSEFIKLERADASKVVDMLKDIFEKGTETGQPGVRSVKVPGNVPQPMPVEAGGAGILSEEAIIVGKIKLTPDVRTNRIHVVTRPINMPFIRQLIHEFDANVEFGKPVTRPLRYISAGEVLPVLVQALSEPGMEGEGAGAGAAPGGAPGQSPQPRQKTGGTSSYGGSQGLLGGSSSTAAGGGSTINISEELSTEPVDTTPKAVTIGNAKLIADQRANSIIMLGNREVVVKVEKILDEMDVKAPQVALSTVIGQLQLSNNEEFGVDWFAKYNKRFVGTSRNNTVFAPGSAPSDNPAIPFPSVAPSISPGTVGNIIPGNIIDPSNLINFSQIIQNVGNGTNIYVAAGNAFAAIVHFLESTGRFRVMSRPTVFTSNNKKAIIASGQEVPVPVNTLTNANAGIINQTAAVSASIEYKKVATHLEVVPLINSEKEVSLDILQKIDNVVQGQNVNIGGNSVPTIATKYVRTNVSAANGSTIILGGLVEDQKQKNYQGFPYLSRIPLIGAAFRSTATGKTRTELIILMCPQVTLTKFDAYRLRQKYEDTTHFGPELDQNECPDCPKTETGKQLALPPPDIPAAKDM